MKHFGTLFIAMTIWVSIVHIFGIETITYHYTIIFLSIAGLIELYSDRKKKKS